MSELRHRRLRAPSEQGGVLIEPPRHEVAAILAANRTLPAMKLPKGNNRADSLRWQARSDLLAAARAYTAQYRDVGSAVIDPAAPILMSGHQPELFHAGVWFKNFLLSSLAKEHQATAINLIVDNDTVDAPAIRVPTGTPQSPLVETVAIDATAPGIPFEQRALLDQSLFISFDQRVCEPLRPWVDEPLVSELWKHVKDTQRQPANLGQALAQARHALEGEWGLNTLEIPLSAVAAQPAFRAFAMARLWNARELQQHYNAALHDYRRVNHIRSRSHPAPDLAIDGEWCETPFWIWTNDQPSRRRLFVRECGGGLQLSDRQSLDLEFPADEDLALERWEEWERRGTKIRPRALLTTMYVRLMLCDLFIHGIGGAKYDELNDEIIRRMMGIEPPQYLTATATVQLPLAFSPTTAAELSEAQHEARELRFHAEQYMRHGDASELFERKQSLLREIPPRGAKQAWHREMAAVNEALHSHVAQEQQQMNHGVADLAEQRRITRLLGSREFSFCLYPADFLRTLLLDLSRATP